jgi:hypothetical protein
MKMVEPVEMPLPPHAHAMPRRDLGAPQTSTHDVCATRCAEHVRQLGGENPLPNLMEVKG